MTSAVTTSVLVMGIGNPARQDDGLGTAASQAIEQLSLPGVTVDADYQLTVEDAADMAKHDVVVYIDASINAPEPFSFSVVEPESENSFSTHSVRPPGVVALARDLFHADAEAYVLGIRGYSFEMFTETMTDEAEHNLQKAIDFIVPVLKARSFSKTIAAQSAHKRSDTIHS